MAAKNSQTDKLENDVGSKSQKQQFNLQQHT
jgi:hypothetical protein